MRAKSSLRPGVVRSSATGDVAVGAIAGGLAPRTTKPARIKPRTTDGAVHSGRADAVASGDGAQVRADDRLFLRHR